jgi:hypothetical protein
VKFRSIWAFASLIAIPFATWGQMATTPERCPEKPWTDEAVAKAIGVAPEKLGTLKAVRALTNEDVCTMREASLRRALLRTEKPRPAAPGEWARFRAMQQADENGRVRPDGLLRALEVRRNMLARSPQAILGSAAPPAAGINPGGWTALGPGNIGGRIRAVAIHPTQHNTVFIGSVSGGIWKTTDAGTTWAPVNDFMGNLSISSIVFAPDNPNVMYAGTGEGFFNIDAVRGAGIFKSLDGGVTWSALSATNPTVNSVWYYVNRIAIHPTNANVLLAATNSGIYRSDDAGVSWTLRTGTNRYTDVRFDPLDGSKALASRGFGGGAIQYSTDGGAGWNDSTLAPAGRVELAYSRTANVVYASVDTNPLGTYNPTGSVYRSSNGGVDWTLQSSPVHLAEQGWYNNTIWVDPTDSNHVVVGGLDLYRSTNAGANFTKISTWSQGGSVHGDHHAIVSSPGYNGTSNRTIFFGNDGGMYKAADIAAVTATNVGWTNLNNGLSITQFYSGAGHNGVNGQIIGGTQDNGSLRYSGTGTNWSAFYGGDGGHSAIDPTNGAFIYGEYVRLQIHRATTVGGFSANIFAGLNDAVQGKANFIAPFTIDPNNPNTLIAGGESVWRSTNAKAATPSWSFIQSPTGGGGSNNYTSHVHVAKGNSNLIWNGKNSGALFKSVNGTDTLPTWNQMGSGVLPTRMVLTILVDADTNNTVYVGFGGYTNQNLWKTTNGGTNWTNIGSGLPPAPVRTIQRHPSNPNFLYAGTEVGIYTSEDGGSTWNTSNDGPANVSVDQLFWLDSSTLVAATHGRGMFRTTPAVAANYTLTVAKAGTGSGPVSSSPGGIACGSICSANYASGTIVTLTATPNAGSVFAGWSGACTGTSTCVVTMNAAKNVTATFNPSGFALTVTKTGTGSGPVTGSPSGIVCGSACTANYAAGTVVTLTASPSAGSVFDGWSGACTGTSTCVVTMSTARNVTAVFNKPGFVLTVSKTGIGSGPVTSSPSGIVCGSACSATYATNTVVTLTASPSAGSVFAGWSGACTGTSTCVVTMSAARNVTANFSKPGYVLTVNKAGDGSGPISSSPAGVSCGSACAPSFAPNTVVTLTATASAGSVFGGWSGACTGTSTCVVTMNAAKSVTATFNKPGYTLTVSKAGPGSGPVSSSPSGISCGSGCSASFAAGTAVTLTASASAGSVFGSWSGACTGTSTTCVVNMNSAQAVTANYILSPVLATALDNSYSWTTAGNAIWTSQAVTTHDGVDAAQSGTGMLNDQMSSLQTTIVGPGTLSFWWNVSSETGFDFLSFHANGVQQEGAISGSPGWSQQNWMLPVGTHTIEFRYSKDFSETAGSDRGWLDQVTFSGSVSAGTPVSPVPAVRPAPAKPKK